MIIAFLTGFSAAAALFVLFALIAAAHADIRISEFEDKP